MFISFHIVLDIIPNNKIRQWIIIGFTIQVRDFIKKKLQHRCLYVINAKFLNIYFQKYQQTAAAENLSGAVFWVFQKKQSVDVLRNRFVKTSAKLLGNCICWMLFSTKLQTFNVKFY